jgi:hypothetical protein
MIVPRIVVASQAWIMFETVLILLFSSALFVYWFRYTVLLLLNEEQSATSDPTPGQLSLLQTREALRQEQGSLPLDRLHRALENDYRLLRYLLDHAAGLGLGPLEHYLLILDYRVMAIWYRLTRRFSTSQARRALDEMACVLTCIAHKMGERSITVSQA